MKRRNLGNRPQLVLGACLTLGVIPQIHAADGLAELLLKKGVITAEEYKQLKQESLSPAAAAVASTPTTAPAPVSASAPPASATPPAPAMPSVSFSKGFTITSIDGSYSAQIGTLMQLDVAGYNDSGSLDNNSGTEMRRGRLYLQGTVLKDWQYKFEMELFGTTGTEVTDAYVRYNGFKPFENVKPLAITAGHFKIPFSLEQLMADKDLSLMERSLPNAFLKSRAPGIMLSSGGEHWSAAAMGFGEQLYSNTTTPQQDEGGGASARVTWAPIASEGRTLHFGLSGQYQKPTQKVGDDTVRFSTRPESHMTSLTLIDTRRGTTDISGNIGNVKLLGGEVASAFGSVTLSAEYIRAQIARDVGADLTFDGWYAQAGWMLTGESRGYEVDKGIFKGIAPAHPTNAGGSGAWELIARYSEIDLNDATITGGRERNTTLGLGWYANNFVRISGNWVHVYTIDEGTYDGATMNALQMRFQFAY